MNPGFREALRPLAVPDRWCTMVRVSGFMKQHKYLIEQWALFEPFVQDACWAKSWVAHHSCELVYIFFEFPVSRKNFRKDHRIFLQKITTFAVWWKQCSLLEQEVGYSGEKNWTKPASGVWALEFFTKVLDPPLFVVHNCAVFAWCLCVNECEPHRWWWPLF